MWRLAAIDRQDNPGDKGRVVRAEETDRLGYLFRRCADGAAASSGGRKAKRPRREDDARPSAVDSDDESDEESDDEAPGTLGDKILAAFQKRTKKVVSDFAILAWILSVKPEIREDVKERCVGKHRDAAERVIKKLYAHDVDADMA